MAIRTVGDGKTYATYAAAYSAASSGDEIEIYYTTADVVNGYSHGVYAETVDLVGGKNITVTGKDRVIFEGGDLGLDYNDASTSTVNNLIVRADVGGRAHTAATGTFNANSCIFIGFTNGFQYASGNNLSSTLNG